MNMKKQPRCAARIYFIVIVMTALHVCISGQVTTEPILVDEYGSAPCDDFLGRLDVYIWEMKAHPDSKGLIVIRNPSDRRHGSVMLKRMMEAWFGYREFASRRVQVVRVDGKGYQRQFWRIPPGAVSPEIGPPALAFQISDTVRNPFMLANETKFGEQICPQVDDQAIYADFLKANPSARGNIVVRDDSETRARKKATAIRRKLKRKYGIAGSRLRTFTALLTMPSNTDEPIVEYWYLP